MNKKSVAVIVITYNSAEWILETLESIKNQSYKNIELIISDDFSEDNTIDLCEKWIQVNKSRFIRIKIRKNCKNEGVTKNINRGIKESTSNWIKLIAGDDILLEKCIESNLKFCIEKDVMICFSKIVRFKEHLGEKIFLSKKENYQDFKKSSKNQFKKLIRYNFVPAPTSFFKKSFIEVMGYFDENYPMIEDYPMWLKITQKGIKLNFFNENTVCYRISLNSISSNSKVIINEKMFEFRKRLYKDYIKNKIKNPLIKYSEKLMWIRYYDIIKKGNKNKFTIISLCTYLIDPYTYLEFFKKIIKK